MEKQTRQQLRLSSGNVCFMLRLLMRPIIAIRALAPLHRLGVLSEVEGHRRPTRPDSSPRLQLPALVSAVRVTRPDGRSAGAPSGVGRHPTVCSHLTSFQLGTKDAPEMALLGTLVHSDFRGHSVSRPPLVPLAAESTSQRHQLNVSTSAIYVASFTAFSACFCYKGFIVSFG